MLDNGESIRENVSKRKRRFRGKRGKYEAIFDRSEQCEEGKGIRPIRDDPSYK